MVQRRLHLGIIFDSPRPQLKRLCKEIKKYSIAKNNKPFKNHRKKNRLAVDDHLYESQKS